jgi:hypothetical protein
MTRYAIYEQGRLWAGAESLVEAVDLVRYGDPRRGISALPAEERDTITVVVRDRRYPYQMLRRLSFREALAEVEAAYARDAGDVCHVCGQIVTWTDHLPALTAGEPVRCYVNVRYFPRHSVRV